MRAFFLNIFMNFENHLFSPLKASISYHLLGLSEAPYELRIGLMQEGEGALNKA